MAMSLRRPRPLGATTSPRDAAANRTSASAAATAASTHRLLTIQWSPATFSRYSTGSPLTEAATVDPMASASAPTRRTAASGCRPKSTILPIPRAAAAAARRSKWELSRLSTATPPSTTPLKISALASAMASTLSKWALWTASTAVTTATWGRAMRDSGSISPAWFIPISNTPKETEAGMRARLSGRPQ